MAIQLSDRDTLIFRFIEEHQVLLEKHIAWFISCDDKPVLIRDRLRKLFYLDYLLCERHGGKLPWWTTPTKPLVYMLSPISRQLLKIEDTEFDLANAEAQRHLLEVANLRMLFLVDQKDSLITDLEWTTLKKSGGDNAPGMDAVVCFKRNGTLRRIGLINHPSNNMEQVVESGRAAIAAGKVDDLWIISRDEAMQLSLQKDLHGSAMASKIYFATHQDIYKSGVSQAKWQGTITGQFAPTMSAMVNEQPRNWTHATLSVAPAM